ncbi:tRNA pseudouridine(38-40) synthase TruA [Bacillaceae bacterium S4-13-58]
MKRMKFTISYDGTFFSGYQVQPNGRTVQEEIEKVLTRIHKGEFTRITASGRTDAGVHAKGQVIHFDTKLNISSDKWIRALQSMLPPDIVVVDVEEVSDRFHARFDVIEKEYRYRVLTRNHPDVFRRNFVYHYPGKLNESSMQEACQLFKGEHDFSSFCGSNSMIKGDKIRTIFDCKCEEIEDEIVFIIRGNGFLYNMVRIIVGTLLEIGRGEYGPSQVLEIIKAKDRQVAGKTAPAHGLILWEVKY